MSEAPAQAAEQPTVSRRKSAKDRRSELIGIGLRLLVDTPIHELSIDRVAEEASISRGLLFHYFDTKTDFYVAVVEAAARRILKQARDPKTGTSTERLRAITTGFVAFIHRRTPNYVALVRGAAGGDERIAAAVRSTRTEMADRILIAAGITAPSSWQTLKVCGWVAMAEEMAIESAGTSFTADELVEYLLHQLGYILDAATPAT
jgi:AcrR family transcriptional regulator